MSGAVLAAQNWLGYELKVQTATLIIATLGIVIALPYGIEGVAWAIVGTAGFSGLYMLWLVLKCLKARWLDSLRALIPATLLNAVLALALFLLQQLLPPDWRAHDLVNVAIMGTAGGLIYAGSLLYFPSLPLRPSASGGNRNLD